MISAKDLFFDDVVNLSYFEDNNWMNSFVISDEERIEYANKILDELYEDKIINESRGMHAR